MNVNIRTSIDLTKNKKRYYNREAVVISALQVEKHPLTTPGPYSTPPLPRHPLSKKHSLITMTPPPMNRFEAPTSSRTASPIPARPASSCASASYGSPRVGEGFRCSPKPHSSPKMKLRWRKPNQQQQHHASFIPYLSQAGSSEPKSQTRCHHFVSLCIFFHFFVFERLPHLFTIPWLFKAIFGSFLRLRSIFRSISLSVVVSFRFISFFSFFGSTL